LTDRTVLVTGAAGFVGWHTCRALLDAGWHVIGLDNFDPFYPRSAKEAGLALLRAEPGFRFVEADVRASEGVAPLLDGVDAVVHLAARPGVRQSVNAAETYRAINELGTARLLEACDARGARRIVFASSSSVYGAGVPSPFQEDGVAGAPMSPYAESKRAGEELALRFAQSTGGIVAIVRLFSVYGPRQRPDLALSAFTRRLRAGLPVPVFGDGSSRRDYTHCDDVARGIVAAVDWTAGARTGCEAFNLGSGAPVRLDWVVAELSRHLGVPARMEPRPAHPADMPITWADTTKARTMLGFEARVRIHDGIADFVSWYEREHGRQPCPAA